MNYFVRVGLQLKFAFRIPLINFSQSIANINLTTLFLARLIFGPDLRLRPYCKSPQSFSFLLPMHSNYGVPFKSTIIA